MLTHLSKWGNSLGVRIPRSIANQIGFSEGEPVDLIIEDSHLVIQKTFSLESLLIKITPENIHSEIAIGTAVGKETW